MPRKKAHEDGEILALLVRYWEDECSKDPRSLSYPGFARYLNEHGIGYDSNVLKHREAVVNEFRRYKASLDPSAPAKAETRDPGDYKALKDKYTELLRLVSEAFTESACAMILKNHSKPVTEAGAVKPEAARKAVIGLGEKPFENEFARKMVTFANLGEEKEETCNGQVPG